MLDSNAIDQIFGRLHVRYGVKLSAAYQGLEMRFVKADWADVLDGASSHCIAYALANLPNEWPPTAGQFLILCHSAPVKKLPTLDRPEATPEERERVRALLAGIKQKLAMKKAAA